MNALTFRRAFPALALCFAALSSRAEPKYDYHVPLTPENALIGHFSPTKKPVVRIKSGQTVKIDGGGGVKWGDKDDPDAWLKANGIEGSLATIPALAETVKVLKETPRAPGISSGHLLVGPVYVEEAEPGDTLEIRILSIVPRIPYGNNGGSPGGGGIPELTPRAFSKVVKLDLKRNVGIYAKNIEVPLGPFNGDMATCPADEEGLYGYRVGAFRLTSPPGNYGGNLDCKELVGGTSLFLPVFHKGALFYTGDCHAAQGDGEVSISAIETANTAYLQFVLHKGKPLKWPRAENKTHFIGFGLDPDLNKAMRHAITEAIAILGDKRGMNFPDAYALCSVGVDFHVTQFVDKTLGIHAMIPKKFFTDLKDDFWAKAP